MVTISGIPTEVGSFDITLNVCKASACAEKKVKISVKENIAINLYRLYEDKTLWVKIDQDELEVEDGITIKHDEWIMARAISADAPEQVKAEGEAEEGSTEEPVKPQETLASGATYAWNINDTDIDFAVTGGCIALYEGLIIINHDPYKKNDDGEWNKNTSTVFLKLLEPKKSVEMKKFVVSATNDTTNDIAEFVLNSEAGITFA